MVQQAAVTVRAAVLPGMTADVHAGLVDVRKRGPNDPDLPLADLPGLHFARIFVIEEAQDLEGQTIPPSLVYMADVDGTVDGHLGDLADRGAAGIDALFGHCESYPGAPDVEQRTSWLVAHSLQPAAYYVHTVGRSVDQVRDEARLRDELEYLADDPALEPGMSAMETKQRLVATVRGRPELGWATRRARGPGWGRAVLDVVLVAAVVVLGLVLLPVLLPVGLLWLLAVRVRETTERPEAGPPEEAHLRTVLEYEDHGAQNPFTAIGLVKPGFVRPVTMRVALRGLEFANRHLFRRDNLAGVRTIHFARWLPIDDGRRLVFASAYDGSLESYMDDFIDRLHLGINLVFSNGVGFPRTRWLVLDGARDETAYKNYLRRHQIPTVVFYSAYPSLTARTVDTNATLRRDLTARSDRDSASRWLELL